MEGQSQWSTSWVQCIDLHWYGFKFSWSHSCWSQDSQTYLWQVHSKLAMLIPTSYTMLMWQGRWIYWTKFSMVIENVQHEGCLLNQQAFPIQCNLWKDASDSKLCAKNTSTYISFTKYDSSLRHNWWCTAYCNEPHVNNHCYYLR